MKNEIERKFFVKELPDLKEIKSVHYERYFIERKDGAETRVQKVDGKYFYEHKVQISELERTREKKEISQKEFDDLRVGVSEVIIRDKYILSINPYIAVQVYHGRFEGLMRAEVEFDSEKDANVFCPLDWMGGEMTYLPIAKDSKLLDLTKEEFDALILNSREIN